MSKGAKFVLIALTSYWVFSSFLGFNDSWAFWTAVIFGWIFSFAKNQISTSTQENASKEGVVEDEATFVRREADKIKKAAMKSGVPELISRLFHNDIKYYPSWTKHPRNYVPKMVTAAKEIKDGVNKNVVLLEIGENEYKFHYEEHSSYMPDDNSFYGDLDLYSDDEKVIHVNEIVTHDEWSSHHRPISVDAFIDGAWVKDFEKLEAEIKEVEKLRKKEAFENPTEIEKLKKSFGIR